MVKPVKIWTTFTKICNGKEVKLQIQELPEENFKEALDLLYKYRVLEEPLHKAAKVADSPESLEEYKRCTEAMFRETKYRVVACCVVDEVGQSRVVGVSLMFIVTRGDPHDDWKTIASMVQTKEMKTLLSIAEYLTEKCKLFDKITVDTCYQGRGAVVDEEYRGLGIAGELFRARTKICKEQGVPMTSAWMTSIGSQRAAERQGWKTIFEINYKELGKEVGVEFDDEPATLKLMIYKVHL